jgi:hypothetical protein
MSTSNPTFNNGFCIIHGHHGMTSCPQCSTTVPMPLPSSPEPQIVTVVDAFAPGGPLDRIAGALEQIARILEELPGQLT